MKKYLVYWSIFLVIFAAIFVWWWTRPTNYIERITTLHIEITETLFNESANSSNISLYKAERTDVKKIIDGCEFHGGTFAAVDQTSATGFKSDAAFNAHGLFKSDHIGCLIKGNNESGGWEFFVKDDLLYLLVKR
ncbi:MAG: hypothetical protein B0W54_15920 [Cellvibrio sp. 79]|nr:MAG: hypothetical protein B0W54_15920 [Cellvibrio sp. 79]